MNLQETEEPYMLLCKEKVQTTASIWLPCVQWKIHTIMILKKLRNLEKHYEMVFSESTDILRTDDPTEFLINSSPQPQTPGIRLNFASSDFKKDSNNKHMHTAPEPNSGNCILIKHIKRKQSKAIIFLVGRVLSPLLSRRV